MHANLTHRDQSRRQRSGYAGFYRRISGHHRGIEPSDAVYSGAWRRARGEPACSKQLGLEPVYVNGQRVTDEASLEVVEMVLSGRVNKQLTLALLRAGVDALGMSGVDRGLLQVEPWSRGDGPRRADRAGARRCAARPVRAGDRAGHFTDLDGTGGQLQCQRRSRCRGDCRRAPCRARRLCDQRARRQGWGNCRAVPVGEPTCKT